MPEMTKARHEEYNNLRPLILIICFAWGVLAGFSLNFFSTPQLPIEPQTGQQTATADSSATAANATNAAPATQPMSETERRYAGAPAIASVDSVPAPVPQEQVDFESMQVSAPSVILTTEGGLTGKNAKRPRLAGQAPAAPPGYQTGQFAAPPMPLIPDLNP